ncbi:DNA polymerase III subunit gamma/tau, partial [Patescibacteria group bacterium]|nr:DNA polymerase III subunit gamma/tau [Patescibacteria group bacterium]
MFNTERMSRSFFIAGPYGTGKTTTSRIIARYAVCLEPKEGVPCGKCSSCLSFKSSVSSHPDIEEINGSDNRKIDDIRGLIQRLNFSPIRGRY